VVHYRRDEQSARQSADAIEAAGGEALLLPADLQDEVATRRLLATAGERFGRLDVLVANAASTTFRPLTAVEPRHLELTFRTVIQSFLLLAQGAVPLMAGRPGSIVAVSGIDALRVMAGHGLLGAAKAALEQLVRYLAVELAPDITVNAVMPGFVATGSARFWGESQYPGGAAAMEADVCARTPAGRIAEPEEIAGIIAFLASPAAAFLRGQVIVADGGLTLLTVG
jgi:enoyl-[acyl-carrier protein] reductase III